MGITAQPWGPRPADLELGRDEIHVWLASLDQPQAVVRRLAQSLSGDERLRAERFRFEQDRRRFSVGRGLLRVILARYLGVAPSRMEFRFGPYGKPALAGLSSGDGFRFNVSHSHGLALYAFGRHGEVGVDLEYVRPVPDADEIAERCFAPGERAALRALPPRERHRAFFRCWTRKEAYIKAVGDGLTRRLDGFEVSLAPGEPARLVSVAGAPEEASRWWLEEIAPAPQYVAALACEGHRRRLACWEWADEVATGGARR